MAARKVKLADVLWDAANECLWDGAGPYPPARQDEYSCNAVNSAAMGADKFLDSLGCPWVFAACPAWEWTKGATSKTRQGVRYMWLLLAMHVAEDEGIEIEVSA